MRAIGLVPHKSDLQLYAVDQPTIQQPNQVLVRVLEVGVCGTDRELAAGHIGAAPPNEEKLIIGHEMVGEVAEAGAAVADFKPGDLVVATVRRPCGHCVQCDHGAVDFCASGEYSEHGIKHLHGFMAEYIVEDAAWLIPVPAELREIGVLLEPLSVSEKALEQARLAFQRIPYAPVDPTGDMREQDWAKNLRTLVAGSGPIGMLGAMILKAHGAQVTVIDRSDEDTPSSRLLKTLGIDHINGNHIETMQIDQQLGQLDLIYEATGAPEFSFRLIDALGRNGVYVMTGIPGEKEACIPVGKLMQAIVLENNAVIGTVNASRENFAQAVADLQLFQERWGATVKQIINQRVAMEDFAQAIEAPEGTIKAVIEIHG